MGLLNLPSIATLPLVVEMLSGIYTGIAAMIVLPLTNNQMTLIAVFLMISHNLVQEEIIQAKSGLGFSKIQFNLVNNVPKNTWDFQCVPYCNLIRPDTGPPDSRVISFYACMRSPTPPRPYIPCHCGI